MMDLPSEGLLFDIGHNAGITPALAMPMRPVPNGAQAG
jgi:tRNA-binding protein